MIRSRRQFLHSLGRGRGRGSGGALAARCGCGLCRRASPGRAAGWSILLDSNENAYGPSPKVADAIRSATGMVNRYLFGRMPK